MAAAEGSGGCTMASQWPPPPPHRTTTGAQGQEIRHADLFLIGVRYGASSTSVGKGTRLVLKKADADRSSPLHNIAKNAH